MTDKPPTTVGRKAHGKTDLLALVLIVAFAAAASLTFLR
jgi:hypothetical protein